MHRLWYDACHERGDQDQAKGKSTGESARYRRDEIWGNHRVSHVIHADTKSIVDIKTCSLKEAVKEDMEVLKTSPYLSKKVKVIGFLFDIFDGSLEEIKL